MPTSFGARAAPASISSTVVRPSSVSREARTQPAVPPPTITKSCIVAPPPDGSIEDGLDHFPAVPDRREGRLEAHATLGDELRHELPVRERQNRQGEIPALAGDGQPARA